MNKRYISEFNWVFLAAKKPGNYDLNTGNTFRVQQNPALRSGLVLAGGNYAWRGEPAVPGREDGTLTAYEVAQMDLSGTDLVVLSGCETTLGDLQGNEGVIGLQCNLYGALQWKVFEYSYSQV